jgi:hypothetical protein
MLNIGNILSPDSTQIQASHRYFIHACLFCGKAVEKLFAGLKTVEKAV